jgi:hypothetical protein
MVENGERSSTFRSRLSSVGRTFQKLNDKGGSASGSSFAIRTTELNEQDMEMNTVPALPTTVRGVEAAVTALPQAQQKFSPGQPHIMITNAVDQRYDRRTSDASSRRFLQGQLGPI